MADPSGHSPSGWHALVHGVEPIMPSRVKRDVAALSSRLSWYLVASLSWHSPSGRHAIVHGVKPIIPSEVEI